MVSAVKMRKAQQAALEGAPYREGLETLIKRVTGQVDPSSSPLFNPKKTGTKKELVIFVSSNKGLCGGFHLNLYRFLSKNTNFETTDFITVGKKGAVFVGKMGSTVIADFSEGMPVAQTTAVFSLALEYYMKGDYKSVSLVYNKFISTLRSEQVREALLPVATIEKTEEKAEKVGEYIVEPNSTEIIDSLLRSFLEEKIRGSILSSEAVEHSSRMIAMKNATDNASDVIYNLTLLGNKLRQTKITMELLDMITAKESVEGSQ